MASATVTLIGSGGVRHVFDLPLSEAFADQLAKGALIPASEADEQTLAAFAAGSATAPTGDPVARPEEGALKGHWVDFAVSQGMELAEAKKMSKAALVALFPPPEPAAEEPEPEVPGDDDSAERDAGPPDSPDDPA